ncbi:MAG: hypothetical protein EA400_16455 [Chromatiaceae bacterium]|nr:MAG: hypothetical protein EA400_16455 [Chromatiaceae bacterium]
MLPRCLLWCCLGLLPATSALATPAADWSGNWRTFWRDGQALLTLTQDGTQVRGDYQPGRGRVTGTLAAKGRLHGRWFEEDRAGTFTFALAPDGQTFAGRFGNGEFWNGVRLAPARAQAQPFTASDSPRETLRTIVTALNATAAGDVDATLIWEPLLLFAEDAASSTRELARRRQLLFRLIDLSTFRIHEAPESGDDGSAAFAIGPAGTNWTFDLEFVAAAPGRWQLLVPRLRTLERALAGSLGAMGFDDYNSYLQQRTAHPRQVMRDFLTGVATWHAGGEQLALATLDLSDISPALQAIEGTLAADFLRQIIDRVGYVIWQEIPDDPVRATPYVHYSHGLGEIAIVPLAGDGPVEWRFSRASIRAAPAIFQAIQTLPVADGLLEPRPFSDYFRLRQAVADLSPALLARGWLLEHWQWLALLSIFAGLALLAWLSGLLLEWLARALMRVRNGVKAAGRDVRVAADAAAEEAATQDAHGDAAADSDAGADVGAAPTRAHRRLLWPLRLLLFGAGLHALIGDLGLPRDVLQALGVLSALLLILGLAGLAYRSTGLVGGHFIRRAEQTASYIDDIVASLATGLVKLAIIISTIIAAAETVGLPYEGVIAGLGIGGLALAIAARETVSNFLGAGILLADRPFKRGDLVQVGGHLAVIETVGLRSTRLRTLEDSLLMVPNGKLADEIIDNFGRRRRRRLVLEMRLAYATARARLEAFVEAVRATYLAQPRALPETLHIGLSDLGQSSIDIKLIASFDVVSLREFTAAKHQLLADIVSTAERLGVAFAFPTRTLHIAPASDLPRLPEPEPDGDPTPAPVQG